MDVSSTTGTSSSSAAPTSMTGLADQYDQFLTLLTDTRWQGSTVQQTLQNLTVQLQEQVQSHSHRELFVATVTRWLAGCVPASESQIKKCAFIHTLLNTLTPWEAVRE